MQKFHEMMSKKRDMKPSEKHAKMSVLKDLKDSLSDSMADKMSAAGPMKKVSVMSNSPQGLNAGLDKAKMMAGQNPMDQDNMMSEGGLALNEAGSDEKYDSGFPMNENAQSVQDPEEPEHTSYDGSPDAKMGPGYADGGEVDASDVTYSGEPHDDGFMHEDSNETDDVKYASGGEVESPLEEAAESADEERGETVGDMGDEEEPHPEFKGLNMQEVEEKLQHLMRMKKQMEKQ